MVEAIRKEISMCSDFFPEQEIDSIYFGGGTPSLLTIDELRAILGSLYKKFPIQADIEITLEANPDDIHPAMLDEWLTAGINRLSIGIQSFDDKELQWMNRSHNAAQSLKCIDEIKHAGFSNFSADIIFGSPLSSGETLLLNAGIIIGKNIPHISCYALTVETGTRLHNHMQRKLSPGIDEDNQANQFSLLTELMENAGYDHYEISNFAKPGSRSRHNSSYWHGKHYVGFGPSAHSYNGCSRRWNVANNALYINAIEKNNIPYEEEILSPDQQFNEYIMTSIRTMEGISLQKIRNMYGNYADKLEKASAKYLQNNLVTCLDDHLVLTKEGKFLADGIASDMFV